MPNLEQGAASEEEQEEEEVVKGGWNLTMDAQVMAWATHQPEVAMKFFSASISQCPIRRFHISVLA